MSSTHSHPRLLEGCSEGAVTRIGVDLGEKNLLAAAPADAGPDIEEALVINSGVESALYDEVVAITRRLQTMEADTRLQEAAVFEHHLQVFNRRFAEAIAELWEFLDQFGSVVLVLEDLPAEYRPLITCRHGEVDAGTWLLPAFQRRLATASVQAGYPITYVDPDYTTKECHICGVHGERSSAELLCVNDGCPVNSICRDRSAAATIAQRFENGSGQV